MENGKSGVNRETGMEFLLRMRPQYQFKSEIFGAFSTSHSVFLSTPCSYSKGSALTKIIVDAILPKVYGGMEINVLLLDLGYQLNMLAVLDSLERKLKSQNIPSNLCDKVISTSPSRLKVYRASTSLELVCLLASIKESIVHENISIVVCNCSNIYSYDKSNLDYLYSTLCALPQLCKVAVIFMCYIIPELPAIKFPQSADLYWSITRAKNDPRCHMLTIKQTDINGKCSAVKHEYQL